jgi:hypothetical protein
MTKTDWQDVPLNWGTTVTPPEKRIDPSKTYRTRSGKRVLNLEIVLHNSVGNEVTFPVKGTIITCEKPLRTAYGIWTLDGRSSVLVDITKLDLVEVS